MDKSKKIKKAKEIVAQYQNQKNSSTDPQGSYTGRPVNPKETPVQDADDLQTIFKGQKSASTDFCPFLCLLLAKTIYIVYNIHKTDSFIQLYGVCM